MDKQQDVRIGSTSTSLYDWEDHGPLYLVLGVPATLPAIRMAAWEVVHSTQYGGHTADAEAALDAFRSGTNRDLYASLVVVALTGGWAYRGRGGVRGFRAEGSVIGVWSLRAASPLGDSKTAGGRPNLWDRLSEYAGTIVNTQEENVRGEDQQAEEAETPRPAQDVGPGQAESSDDFGGVAEGRPPELGGQG